MAVADKPSFFITTPIYYVNAAPHLGTAYCTMLCDVQARYRRAAGYDVKFLTGMDEHGEKVAEAAQQHGLPPRRVVRRPGPRLQSGAALSVASRSPGDALFPRLCLREEVAARDVLEAGKPARETRAVLEGASAWRPSTAWARTSW